LKEKNSKDLFKELVKTNFKIRYNNSVLGFLWVLLKPFLTFVIMYTVWTAFRGQRGENYQVMLLLGVILFTFVNEAIVLGMNGLLDKAHIILKVNFDRKIAVLSSVAMSVINLCINLIIFLIFAIFNPIQLTFAGAAFFIFSIAVSVFLMYSIDLFLSILLIKLRDLQHIFELFFQLLFWVTPIFYDIDEIGGGVGRLISFNPVGMLISISRQALIEGHLSTITIWRSEVSSVLVILIAFLVSIFMFFVGSAYFKNQVKKVAEYF
jgi:ABC-2 type transport system permease protein